MASKEHARKAADDTKRRHDDALAAAEAAWKAERAQHEREMEQVMMFSLHHFFIYIRSICIGSRTTF